MTVNDNQTSGSSTRSPLANAMFAASLVVGLIFCVGASVGFISAMVKHEGNFTDLTIAGLLAALAAYLAWQLVKRTSGFVQQPREKTGPSERKVQRLWAFFVSIGLLAGGLTAFVSLAVEKDGSKDLIGTLYSNAPISPTIAIILLVTLAATTVGSVFYYRYIDEHNRAAQESASLVAFNVYLILTMAWWIAARGQLAPAVHAGWVFAASIAVWTAVWLKRRFF